MMKHTFLTIALLTGILLQGCKKDKTTGSSPDALSTKEFSYIMATKQLSPDTEIYGELKSRAGIKLIY